MIPIPLLIDELVRDAPPANRCPHLDVEPGRCLCRSPAAGPPERGYGPDHASLQLWCLAGAERWPSCILFEASAA